MKKKNHVTSIKNEFELYMQKQYELRRTAKICLKNYKHDSIINFINEKIRILDKGNKYDLSE